MTITTRINAPDDLWKSISGFETVAECIEVTGTADYYVSDGMWISPCGVSKENRIGCSCGICKLTKVSKRSDR